MAEISKTIEEIEDMFRLVVLTILELNPEDKQNRNRVRFPWGSDLSDVESGSAPAPRRNKDTCMIYALPHDDPYNRQRNRRYIDDGCRDLIEVDEHTDVHFFNFVNYGPNAYECARKIRDGLFCDDIRRLLKQNHFFLVPDVPAIKRLPELIDGEWWNRADCTAIFNEYVRLERPMKTIEKITINALEIGRPGLISGETAIERNDASG